MQDAGRHPTDQLIQDLIAHPRTATAEEIQQIVDRIAVAPFNTAVRTVSVDERGRTYQGIILGQRADALTLHLIKRVIIERQWAMGTTAMEYVNTTQRVLLTLMSYSIASGGHVISPQLLLRHVTY